jgi:hypothetical protein
MTKKRVKTPLELERERMHAEFEREQRIYEEYDESPMLKDTHVCLKCFALVHTRHRVKHFDWHDGEDTRFNRLERDVQYIERNVELPPRMD